MPGVPATRRPRVRLRLVAVAVLVVAAAARAADPPGTPRSREALALCQQAADAPAAERPALLARSAALAEQAIGDHEDDALAHFAAFCAVGGEARIAGASLLSLWKVHRLRREIDRTLALAPDYADALLGKGSLLLHLPRLLGGDAAAGERLVRRALAVDPEFVEARLELAHALADRGRRAGARAEAAAAAVAAERAGQAERAAEARRLEADLAP
ncbi:MAG TPA: hypothetical protein VKW76_00515 [Candidatus Binatia bacterium]|nr:hypothetical protein [Candidatus Binatia bacterium]